MTARRVRPRTEDDVVVGIGLLARRPWTRTLAIVLSSIGLPPFPLGTIVGVYGLRVLFTPQAEALPRA